MKYLRVKPFQRFFCIVLALVVFNLSIDPPDMLRNLDADPEMEEDLSVNEIESISELLLEKGLDMENAVPETDDPDSDNFVKKAEIFSSIEKCFVVQFNIHFSEKSILFFYQPSATVSIWTEILNPPPEA